MRNEPFHKVPNKNLAPAALVCNSLSLYCSTHPTGNASDSDSVESVERMAVGSSSEEFIYC